ncbi:MAG: PIN domain-containing protein [Anaerolineae bacterium]|jgi:predicted nucleic acid-binding protein|nr:PIN domain-containing protein [Anaerolineae bacterium]
MTDKPKILLDLNIILDVFQKRDDFYSDSAKVLELAEIGVVQGFICAHSVTTLFYILNKSNSVSEAKANITSLFQFISITNVDQSTIEQALNLDYPDFEDAVQMVSAVQNRLDYLITRNPKNFLPSLIPVVQPVEFLAWYKSSKSIRST